MFTENGKPVISFLRAAAILLILALLLAPLTIALAALSGIDHRWVDILAQFTAPTLIATVFLVAASLPSRQPHLSGLGGGVILLLLIAVLPQWTPPGGWADRKAPVLRLYSANIWTENTNVDAIRRSVADADPDIVLLVELGSVPGSRLDEILAGYPHRITTPRTVLNGRASNAVIASRYPVVELEDAGEDLSDIAAVVRTPLGPLNVIGIHLTRPWPFQYQWGQIIEVDALIKQRARLTGPVIVAGDFNSVSTGRIGRQVQAGASLRPASGWPGTWPSDLPSAVGLTIDQVYRSQDLAFVSRRLGKPTGSDHRPVITEFTLAAD